MGQILQSFARLPPGSGNAGLPALPGPCRPIRQTFHEFNYVPFSKVALSPPRNLRAPSSPPVAICPRPFLPSPRTLFLRPGTLTNKSAGPRNYPTPTPTSPTDPAILRLCNWQCPRVRWDPRFDNREMMAENAAADVFLSAREKAEARGEGRGRGSCAPKPGLSGEKEPFPPFGPRRRRRSLLRSRLKFASFFFLFYLFISRIFDFDFFSPAPVFTVR